MGDYQQQNQRVRRDQYNADGNINLHHGGFQQQGQNVGRDQQNVEGNFYDQRRYNNQYRYNDQRRFEEHIGRDKAGRDINNAYYTANNSDGGRGAKHYSRAWVINTILVLLFSSGLIGGGVWWFFQHPLHFSLPGSTDPNTTLQQELKGTPDKALENFCHSLQSGDLQGAYDDFSSHLKTTYSQSQFTTDWSNNKFPHSCTASISTSDAGSASGTLLMTVADSSGFNTSPVTYNVTLVSDNGIWEIDSWKQV